MIDTGGGEFSGSSSAGGNDELQGTVSVGGKVFNLSGPTVGSKNGVPIWLIGLIGLGAFYFIYKGGLK